LLIQRPPGTGKTIIIVEIAYNLLKQNPNLKLLITAPSNVAAAHFSKTLLNSNHKVVLYVSYTVSESEALIDKSIDNSYVHNIILSSKSTNSQAYQSLYFKDKWNELNKEEKKEFLLLRDIIFTDICKNADIMNRINSIT
jgi:superfamily II DNA or RNA helicase